MLHLAQSTKKIFQSGHIFFIILILFLEYLPLRKIYTYTIENQLTIGKHFFFLLFSGPHWIVQCTG